MNLKTEGRNKKKSVWFDRGRIYFDREMERKFYFAATVCLMAVGLGYKAGWF